MNDLHRSIYPNVVSSALLAAAPINIWRWDRALGAIETTQRHLLSRLLRRSRGTVYGRELGFSRIRTYEDFARDVPIGDYDHFAPYIERMKAGEANVLLPERVRYFGNSSGSSDAGRSKWLPISNAQIAHTQRAGADALMRYLAWRKDGEFLRGFTLGLFHPVDLTPHGDVILTTNPVLMTTKIPLFARPLYLPDQARNQIADYDAKMTAIAERYLNWDIRAVTGTTCWFPVLFERVLQVARAGGRRVRNVGEIWPNLRVLLGGGVSAAPYLPLIRELVGSDVALVDTYNATEGGIFASTDFTGARGMLMLPHRGTFFELVPVEHIHDAKPPRVPLWKVERDRVYAIVVTTSSGLFAYKLGDLVRFPALDPLRIEFVGRLAGCLSITQELATHSDIEEAVRFARTQCPCHLVEFGAAGEVGIGGSSKSRYLLFVEFGAGAEPDLDAFARAFDEGMRRANRVYGEHRGVALELPRVVPLVAGGAKKLMHEVTRGNFQGKFPRILDESRKTKAFAYARSN